MSGLQRAIIALCAGALTATLILVTLHEAGAL